MIKQFFGKTFYIAFGVSSTLLLLAFLGHQYSLGLPLLIIVGVATVALSFYKLEYGLAFAFIELFSNPHGHLISTSISGISVSLRMVVFAAVMIGWFLLLVLKRVSIKNKYVILYFLPLALAVLTGLIIGFINQNPKIAFQDGNAYFYLLYLLPILSVQWDITKKKMLLQILAACAVWVSVVSIALFYVFSHIPAMFLEPTYVFFRDIRLAEITDVGGGIYRVFIQSQFFSIVFGVLLFALLFEKLSKKEWMGSVALLGLTVSSILLGLSRSFWVGAFLALFAFVILLTKYIRPDLKVAGKVLGSSVLAAAAGVSFLLFALFFPIPKPQIGAGDLGGALGSRATNASDVAISSRWNLLEPMQDKIMESFIVGSGFGHTVTFTTDDPRVRASNPDGTWTTYSMEWGWLEIWLKMGIMAPIGFFTLFVLILKGLKPYIYTEQRWLGVGLMTSLVFLYATHVFSPYLNHPIGLGFILFLIPFLSQLKFSESIAVLLKDKMQPKKQPSVAIASKS